MTQQSEKIPPEVLEEEESAPHLKEKSNKPPLSKEHHTDSPMNLKKFSLGSATLGWCIFLMFLCIILSIWNPDNELIKSGFEAFKLIVMTILGYIFGSNNTKSDT